MVTVNTQHRSCKVNTKFHSITKSVFGVMAITCVTNFAFVMPYVMRVDVQDTSKGHAEKRGQLFVVFTVNSKNAVTVQVEVDCKSIDMLVGTGAGVSVISERTFVGHWHAIISLWH